MQNMQDHYSTKETPQSEKIPGSNQVQNNAGGFSFAMNCWARLNQFLILGSSGGTYYVNEKKLTIDNAEAVRECIKADGVRTVNTIVEISDAGRAPKNDPALFALAMCTKFGDVETRRTAYAALPKVARIGTHLFNFVAYREAFGGWGRGMRNAVAKWYQDKDLGKLAYQMIKYQQRDGWSHRDLLRLSHPKTDDASRNALYAYAVGKQSEAELPSIVKAFEIAKHTETAKEMVYLISEHGLTREMIPTQFLSDPLIWEALLEKMPLMAMIRNLGNLSKCGLLKPMSQAANTVVSRLMDGTALQRSRIHPISVLAALTTYGGGQGVRGNGTWTPVPQVVDALDDAFYLSFGNIECTGKRFLLGIDVSGSMTFSSSRIAGLANITANVAAAAMAMVTARSESQYYAMGFSDEFRDLGITPRMRLDQVIRKTRSQSFGRTDCALPMLWAEKNNIKVNTFVIYTDSETWAGRIHPPQALDSYRQKMGIGAKLVVVGMTSNGFSIADPSDAGMLDVVGFDTATPNIISNF